MNEIVKEWIDKAEGDYRTAHREMAVTDRPNYDAVCFHAQQCAEKLMKAWLIQQGTIPSKTHDLFQLHSLLHAVHQEWSWPIEELRFLTRAAVDFRYPGEAADQEEAAEALDISTRLHEAILKILGE